MPLTPGAPVGDTIKELYHNGSRPRSRDQIIAIAESNHRKRAVGGFAPASGEWAAHQEARNLSHDEFHPKGLFNSDVAGRTDRLPRTVPANSFVFPADVTSAIGSGNTAAGAKILDAIFSSGPYGSPPPRGRRANGGATNDGVSHVMVAGGEWLANPDQLKSVGRRMRASGKSKKKTDLEAGHEAACGLVSRVRKAQMDFLKNAPAPKK